MAREKQPELGIRNPYDARYRITVGPCRGLDQALDPSTIADEALTKAINVRVYDGIVVCRGGQSAPLGTAVTGCVQGMIDINGAGPRFLLAMVRPDTLVNYSDIDMYDRQLSTPYVRVTDPPSNLRLTGYPMQGINQGAATIDNTKPRYCYLWWNDKIIFGGKDFKMYRVMLPEDNLSVDTIQVVPWLDLLVPGESSEFEVASMCTLADVTTIPVGASQPNPSMGPPLYIGTVGGGVVGYVNGQLVRLLPEGTFNAAVIVFRFHDRLYAAGQQDIRVQNGWGTAGSPTSSSWTTLTMPGTLTTFIPYCAVEFGGQAFVGGTDTAAIAPKGRILKIDDTGTVTVINTGSAPATNAICYDDFATAFGALYVSYRAVPTITQAAYVSPIDLTGVLGTPIDIDGWAEDGMVPRIIGGNDFLYISAWASGGGPTTGSPESAIYSFDGTTLEKLADVSDYSANLYAPYDMIGF